MGLHKYLVASGLLGMVWMSPTFGLAKPPPAEAFAATQKITDVAISADGNRIAFAYSSDLGETQVRVMDLSTRKAVGVSVGDKKLRDITFEDGGDVLITASDTTQVDTFKDEMFRTFSFDFETSTIRNLLAEGGVLREYNYGVGLVSILPDKPNRVMMVAYDLNNADRVSLNLYEVATNGTQTEIKAFGNPNTYDWMVDRAGNPIARLDYDASRKTTKMFVGAADKQFEEVLSLDDNVTRAIGFRGLTRGGKIVFSQDTGSELGEIHAIDPTTKAITTFLRVEDVELSYVVTDQWSSTVVGVVMGGLEPTTQMISADLQEAQAILENTFPGKIVSIVDFSRDRKSVVARIETTSIPPEYVLLRADGPKLVRLGEAYPRLKDVPMGRLQATSFKSRDGVDIPVYVTLPPGDGDIKNAPTIIFPHGGPQSRDWPRFDYWAQFMATRGYVVIQPQFRGSTGFGRAFSDAGFRQWGKRMQDDVSDAVAWAVKEGLTDPAKVCIVGGSYGGYAALAGATLTPDLYRCVVSVAGVSDLPRLIETEKNNAGRSRAANVNYWTSHIGDNQSELAAASPRRLATAVRAPILLIHGKDDTVVRFEQSVMMANALKAAGKPHKLVELSGEDHWLSRTETRLQMLNELEAFLRTHLGPGVK